MTVGLKMVWAESTHVAVITGQKLRSLLAIFKFYNGVPTPSVCPFAVSQHCVTLLPISCFTAAINIDALRFRVLGSACFVKEGHCVYMLQLSWTISERERTGYSPPPYAVKFTMHRAIIQDEMRKSSQVTA